MSVWGKILGGAAGFAIGGPIGAILGTAAGHAVDKMRDSTREAPEDAGANYADPESAPDLTNRVQQMAERIASEELLGEVTRPFSSLPGHEAVQQDILIKAEGEPTKRVLIGASLKVSELVMSQSCLAQ